jgi:methyl-accepting chemotaxis protein
MWSLTLLLILGGMSFMGVGGIVENAEEVIDGNKLDGNLAQKEVDHLNWVNQVNALLTDESVTALNVQTDHAQCAFGKWLYGEGRQQAEMLVPELAPLLKAMEEPHKRLHESAIAIGTGLQTAPFRACPDPVQPADRPCQLGRKPGKYHRFRIRRPLLLPDNAEKPG